MPVGKSRQLTDFEKNLKEEIYKRDNHIDNSVKYAIDTGQDYGVSKDTPQWRRDAINKYRDSHKVEIYDDNGNIVGTVGYEAHKAINKNKVFDYKGKNDEERKVFSYLRQRHNRESRKREQREYYATAPYAVKSKAKKETESELFPSVRRPTISGETKNADVLNFRNRTDVKNKYNEIEREASKHRYSDNKVFTVPITQNKKINVKYGVMKKLDGIASRTDLSEYDRAKKMDEVIDQLGLSDDEKKNARSYAGIKKLELSSASNGEDSFLKEITQPIVKFLAGTRDAAESAARFFLKDGMKLDGSYTQAYNEAEKYYTENPDELGNDLFDNYKQGLSTPEGEYLRNAGVDKILEAYNDTTKASQFISDAGFRSAGQMAGDMALVQMAGVPNAMAAAKNIAGAAMSGTKAADTLSKIGNIAPKIKEVAGTGKVTKAANTIINGVNSVSVGKAVKFLNPLDNPTTALMGISAAQDKYSTLKRMGYDDETAKKSALFSGYVSTITEKMGYDGKPESFFLHKGNPVAGSATASKAANAKKVLKDYLKANVGEGVEEIYNTVFDRAGDYFSKIGYVDENGEIKQRKVFGKEGIIDPGDIGENFLGGFVGGAVMGSAGVLSNIAQYDVKTVREYADDVRREVAHSNKVVTELAKEAGVENVNLPSEPNWEKASVDEINDYYSKAIDAHLALLNNEKVIKHDAAEIQKAKNLVITPDGDTARQSVLAAANSGNSESSVISPSVTAAANVSERQMHDVKENLSEGGAAQSVEQVQNAVKKVTNTMINEFKNSNIKNIPNYQAAYDENLRLSTTKGATIDKDFIKTYASQYAEGLKRNNSKAYKELASVSDDVGSMLTDYLISNRIPQGIGDISALAQAGGELRSIVGKAAQTTLAMNGKIYNDTDRVSAISNEISNGNFAVVDGANDGNIALAKVGEYYEAYGADAVALAKAFGVSTHYIQKNGRKTLAAAVPSKYIGEYAAKSGYSGTQYSAGGNEYIYLAKGAERGNLSADAVRSDITAESDSDFIAEIEKNGMIELDERPSESKIETIAAQVERDNTIPVYLDGVDKLGEVLLVYANEEDVTRNMVKTDINSYYDGVMPERGIPLSENTDRHYDEDTIEISERPSEYDADSYALVVELDRTIPILLNGVDELGEVELNYSNEENVTRDMIKSDIDAYYSGTMPEHGVSLSNNYDPDIKFSVESVDGTDKKYVKADRQVISGDNPEEWRKQVYNYINSSIRKGKDINVLSADGDVLTITEDTAGKARFRNTIREPNGNLRKMTNEEFAVKLRAESHIDEIAEVSKKNGYSAIDTKNHHFAKDGFYYRTAYFEDFDGKYYKLTLSVGKSGEINTVYNVGKLKETYGRARDSKVVEQKPNNARRGFSKEFLPEQTEDVQASSSNVRNGSAYSKSSNDTTISQNDSDVNSIVRNNSGNDTDIKFSVDGDGYSKQLVTDFETAAKDIMTISDYSARVNAEARTAVRILENTPNVILDNIEGSANLPIVINFTKMYLAARKSGVIKGNYHNLGSDILMKLPQMISDPDMILQLGNGRLNLLSETKTENGNNAVVSIELNSTKDIEGKNKNYNVVVTLFSANDNYVRNLINKDGTEIKYTKEDLSQVNPRLYNRPATFNDKSSIDNISQNDDIVNSNIRNNSGNDTENVKFSQDNSLDGGGIIRYNDDIDIPYRESKQLREYIMSENNRNGSRLKPFGYKEIGDNFYFWRNNSKTDYDVIAQVEIDGNEDIIDLLRKGLENGKTYRIDKGAKGFNDWLTAVRSGQRSDSGNNAVDTAELSNGNDDRLYSRQSSDDDGIKFDRESNRNQQNTEVGNYGRDDILNGNDRRTLSESERERGSGVQEIAGNAEGNASEEQSSASTRGIYARDVKEAGGFERRNDRGVEADFVKSEYYNDEMRRIAAENDERGVVTHFILGNGRAIEYGTNFRGAVRGNEVYIQVDHGKYSPTQINRHEIIHRNYSSDTVQTLKNRIKSRLTNEQIRNIAESLYRDYAQKRRSFDEIFEEFVCDVMADMNDYAEMFETETHEYWAAEEQDRKGYSPSTYTESIDAGGKNVAENKIEPLAWNSDKKSVHPINAFGSDNNNISQNDNVVNENSKRNIGLQSKIKEAIKELRNADELLSLDTNVFSDKNKKVTEQVKNYFESIGGSVHRSGFGDVILNKRGIKSAIAHGLGRAKCIAFRAVPDVIKYGKQIDIQENWKNRKYDTAVFAGKVNIGDKETYVGVVVKQKANTNEYYLHEVVDESGNYVQIKNNEVVPFKTTSKTNDGLRGGTTSDNTNISQNNDIVNSNIRKNSENDTDIRFSTDENTDVNVSDDEDMSYLSEPVRNIRNDINEVINRADLKKGGKVYDRAAAVRVRDSIIANLDVGVDRGEYLHLSEKDKNAMLVLVNRTLNASAPKRINSEAKILARFIAQKAKVYTAADYDYSGVKSFILDYTRHAVSITPDVKQALITVFGEDSAKGYSALFGKSERTGSAQTIDAIYDEMSDVRPDLFPTDVLGEGEKMRRIAEIYAWAKDGEAETNGSARLIDVMSTEDKQKFANGVYEQLISALDSDYRPSKTRSAMNEIRNEYETEIAKIKGEMKKRAEDRAKRADIRRSPEQWQTERMKNAPEPKKRGKIAQAINDSERVQSAKQRLGIGNGISNIGDIVDFISNKFGVVISTGKVSGKTTGIYKEQSGNMRVRNSNDIPTVAFELGKHLNKTYKFTEMDSIGTLMKQIYYTNSDIFNDFNAGSLGISKLISGADEQALKAKNAAVSEFMREYLLNKDVAKEKYPQFYADFVMRMSDEKVGKKTDVKNLDAAADMINKYMSSPTSERIDAMTVTNKQAKIAQTPTMTESARKFYLDWVDSFNPIKNVMSYVKKVSGGDITGKRDAYTIAMNSLNATTIANYINTKGMTDLDGNINLGKSFIECVGNVKKKDLNTFDRYLIIKHALEWIEPLDENTPKKRVFADETLENPTELRRELAEIEKKHPEMKQAAENLYEFQRNVIENFVIPAGGISQAEYQKLIAKYPSYVPFFRATNKRGKLNQFIKGTLANQSSPIKTANGGGELLISPLESIIRNTEKMVKFGTRQRTMQILAEYADSVDGMGKFMEKVSPDMMMTREGKKSFEMIKDVLADKVNAEDYLDLTGAIADILGDTDGGFSPIADEKNMIVTVMNDGKKSYYQIHDRLLYEAIADMTPQEANMAVRISGAIMNPMKILITQNNPIFALTNAIRDIQTAYKNSNINNPIMFAAKYANAAYGMLKKSDDYKRYQAMGGGHSSELSANMESIKESIRALNNKDKVAAVRFLGSIIRHPIQSIAAVNDFVESTPRFMEFKNKLKQTGDTQSAIYAADDLTTNFKRIGKKGRSLNKVIMYNNAGVQGLDKLRRSFADVPKNERSARIVKYAICALITTALTEFWNRRDDESEEAWENLSAYKKNNFYNFYIGDGDFISIPKARELATLSSFFERCADKYFYDNDEAFYDFGGYLWQQFTPPVLPEPGNPVDMAHSLFGSTVLSSLTDIGFNKDFKGSPIESDYDKNLYPFQRYSENTSKLAVWLGQTEIARKLNISPKQLDHILSSNLGIIGQINKALFPSNESRKDLSFGLRNKFIADSNYSTDVLNKMYDNTEVSGREFAYNPSADNAIKYENDAILSSFVSRMNAAVRSLPDDQQRMGRAYLLKCLKNWNSGLDENQKNMSEKLNGKEVNEDTILKDLPTNKLKWTVNKQDFEYEMNPNEYAEYTKDLLSEIARARSKVSGDGDDYQTAVKEAISNAKSAALERAKEKYAPPEVKAEQAKKKSKKKTSKKKKK